MRSTPLFAADGFATGRHGDNAVRRYEGAAEGASSPMERLTIEAVLAHERHDDGLVHSHGWALSEMMAGPARPEPRIEFRTAASADDRYDDGLVHSHDWAKADVMPCPTTRQAAPRAVFAFTTHADDRYDDGLVHNHHWATSSN
jgi:hypothetical protein